MFAVLFLFSLLVAQNSAIYVGFWFWTWGEEEKSWPVATTHGFLFDGTLLSEASFGEALLGVKAKLPGKHTICVGGGTTVWTQAIINSQKEIIASGVVVRAGYTGVAFDIEEGEAGLSFAELFAAVKLQKLELWVTISHSSPYGVSDAARLMPLIIADVNVDFISPQLYTTGTESLPDFTDATIPWSAYAGIHAKIVPSIPSGSMYQTTYCHFLSLGITIDGYIQWQQFGFLGDVAAKITAVVNVGACKAPVPTKVDPSAPVFACGKDWASASCEHKCPSGKGGECPDGLSCFAGISCLASTIKKGTGKLNACGKSWAQAVFKGCSAKPCPSGKDSECDKGETCFKDIPCATAANSAVVISETQNSDGSTTTTTTVTTSESIPGYGVALLCIAATVIVVLVVLIALMTSKKQSERV